MTISLVPASEVWTVDDLDNLPADLRCEIHNGRLVIMSPVRVWHQNVARAIANALERSGRPVSTDVTIRRTRSDTRMPDVAAFREPPDLRAAVHNPDTIDLVVEVWSPTSEDMDHGEMHWYANLGIGEYWLAEPVGDGSTLEAAITKYALATSAHGETLYVHAGTTTLAELVTGDRANP